MNERKKRTVEKKKEEAPHTQGGETLERRRGEGGARGIGFYFRVSEREETTTSSRVGEG